MKALKFTHHKNRELHLQGLPKRYLTITQGDLIPLDGVQMDEHNAQQFVSQNPEWFSIVDEKPAKKGEK